MTKRFKEEKLKWGIIAWSPPSKVAIFFQMNSSHHLEFSNKNINKWNKKASNHVNNHKIIQEIVNKSFDCLETIIL